MLVVALTVAWLARRDNHNSKKHVRKVIAELEGLQRSEDMLLKLQKELALQLLLHSFVEEKIKFPDRWRCIMCTH
jgi:hypothetical protein